MLRDLDSVAEACFIVVVGAAYPADVAVCDGNIVCRTCNTVITAVSYIEVVNGNIVRKLKDSSVLRDLDI